MSRHWVLLCFFLASCRAPGNDAQPEAGVPTPVDADAPTTAGTDATTPDATTPDATTPDATMPDATPAADVLVTDAGTSTHSTTLDDIDGAADRYAAAHCRMQSRCRVLHDWHTDAACIADERTRILERLGLFAQLSDVGRAVVDDATFDLCVQQLDDPSLCFDAPACDRFGHGLRPTSASCLTDEECAPGLHCTGALSYACGTCEPPVARGQLCRSDAWCEAPLACGTRGVCTVTAQVEQPCPGFFNDTTYCIASECMVDGYCHRRGQPGDACKGDSRPCDGSSAVCIDGTCVAAVRAPDGGACDATHLCYPDFACLSGVCVARHPDGENCRDGVPCMIGASCEFGGLACIRGRPAQACTFDARCAPGLRCRHEARGERQCRALEWSACP